MRLKDLEKLYDFFDKDNMKDYEKDWVRAILKYEIENLKERSDRDKERRTINRICKPESNEFKKLPLKIREEFRQRSKKFIKEKRKKEKLILRKKIREERYNKKNEIDIKIKRLKVKQEYEWELMKKIYDYRISGEGFSEIRQKIKSFTGENMGDAYVRGLFHKYKNFINLQKQKEEMGDGRKYNG